MQDQTAPAPAAQLDDEPPPATLDEHKDALHILPLSSIPLKSHGVRRWSLTKNARLETVVEIYKLDKEGSGQVTVDELHKYFDGKSYALDDLIVLRKLAALNSFDVYSLRIQLRRLNIPVTSQDELKLSEAKKRELVDFMRSFTRPLIQRVYGSGEQRIADFDALVQLFSHPDRGEALRNLQLLANSMQVGLMEIPSFLEEYGDVFLSMAYYRSVFSGIEPGLELLSSWSDEVSQSFRMRSDASFQRKRGAMLEMLQRIGQAIRAILIGFEAMAKRFWDNLGMGTFKALRETVSRQHELIGGLLCGLEVKLRTWRGLFLGRRTSPETGAAFMLSELVPGLDRLIHLADAPVKRPAALSAVLVAAG
jgi:hypothetical protein